MKPTMLYRPLPTLGTAIAALLLGLAPIKAQAQIVEVSTPLGKIYWELLPEEAPGTVANILNYINDNDYENSFIHRSAWLFDAGVNIIQGGGFTFTNEGGPVGVVTDDPITNEFGLSNLRGTVAMAKLGGDPNSATSQWFINLSDENAVLDTNNGGFTVFARVVQGMDVADLIHDLPRYQLGGAFNQMPLLEDARGPGVELTELVLTTLRIATPGDLDGDGDIDDADLGAMFANYTGPIDNGGKTFEDGDTDFDGDVDDADLGLAFGAYTGPLSSPTQVPEPGSLVLIAAGAGLIVVRRRRATR